MPQDHQNKLYSVEKTTAWFAVAAIFLTVTLVLMLFEDHSREWKRYQEKFVELEREKAEEALKEQKAGVDPKELEAIDQKLRAAEEAFAHKKAEYENLIKEKKALQLPLTQAKNRYQDLKQFFDSYKYYKEEYHHKGEEKEAHEYEEKIKDIGPKLEKAKIEQEELEKKDEALEEKIQAFKADQKQYEKDKGQLLKEVERLQKRIEQLEPSAAKAILNAPMLDFIAPSLQIQQVVLEDLYDDFYFAKANKVDRCTTCHLAIDRKGYEDAPQPFKTHPNLDLFLGSTSKHPLEKIGCTVCHGGNGHSLTFTTTAHTPQNEEQKKEWEKKYHWHELEKWEKKMLPLQHTEASCTKCHTGVVHVPEAPKLNEGRDLARKAGCFGCHTVKGFENQWKAGPSLLNVKSKLDKDWIIKWLQDPKAFRSSTWMPRIFHLENMQEPENRAKSNVGIQGIAEYLMKHSGEVSIEKPRKKGNPEIGKELVKDLGCLGCHSVDSSTVNDHGPELINMGSKVKAEWLFTWLKDPKHYMQNTRMPNLRLTDEEASHIASYLLESRNQEFEKSVTPKTSDKDLDLLTMEYLTGKMRHSEAREKISKMATSDKLEFVGREMILQQGCFGCHDIKGFEAMKPIGTELTKQGQKEVTKLDFGFIDIEKTREAWFFQKLKHPRSFDEGKIKTFSEKLRMPQFDFTDEEANSLVTFLLSLREEHIPLEMQKQLDLRERAVEKGRFLSAKYNCQGCHTLDGIEGRARALFEDKGNAPPILDGEGAKVQEDWLYQFLKEPTPIRPWLKYRMPTFGFSNEETDIIVQYFHNAAHQRISFSKDDSLRPSQKTIDAGRELFIKFKCIQCHQGATQGMSASFLAPDLSMAHSRLKPNWVADWLKDPQAIQPGTMMPGFFPDGETPVTDILDGDAMKQIHAIKEYLRVFTPEEAAKVKAST